MCNFRRAPAGCPKGLKKIAEKKGKFQKQNQTYTMPEQEAEIYKIYFTNQWDSQSGTAGIFCSVGYVHKDRRLTSCLPQSIQHLGSRNKWRNLQKNGRMAVFLIDGKRGRVCVLIASSIIYHLILEYWQNSK